MVFGSSSNKLGSREPAGTWDSLITVKAWCEWVRLSVMVAPYHSPWHPPEMQFGSMRTHWKSMVSSIVRRRVKGGIVFLPPLCRELNLMPVGHHIVAMGWQCRRHIWRWGWSLSKQLRMSGEYSKELSTWYVWWVENHSRWGDSGNLHSMRAAGKEV